jgi:ribulose 1,5-bisphosphate synthetase/thiazole synthase
MLAASVILLAGQLGAKEVLEPASSLPVLKKVDVVVVGGGSAGVAAAVEAARSGAKVFVVAPRPYLGEDICGPYRLWLERGEEPATDVAREVFKPTAAFTPELIGRGLRFRYAADKPASARHPDSQAEPRLTDGKWQNASSQSVQFDGNVTLILDFGKPAALGGIHVLAYQRNDDFEVAEVAVSSSENQQDWSALAMIKNSQLGAGGFEETALRLSAFFQTKARFLKLAIQKGPKAGRVLLGEIVVEGVPETPVAKPQTPRRPLATPMQVKRALDEALIKAKIPFLYASHAIEVLRDAAGKPAGVVIANRSGRQAVLAKVIIDVTERANIARRLGARFSPSPSGPQVFNRVVVGGPTRSGEPLSVRAPEQPITIIDRRGNAHPVLEYTLRVPMTDDSFASFAAAEQIARDWTWTRDAVDASESLFQVPPDSFQSRQSYSGSWPGADRIPFGCFQPAGIERLFALGGCADVSREAAAELLRPVNLMAVGARIGQAAAELASREPALEGVRLPGRAVGNAVGGEIRQAHEGANLRQEGARTIAAEALGVPVIGEYDVVVVGGGTGGAPAAIGAGRRGARTLLVEYLHSLGGVGTAGFIAKYYHGNRVGFTGEIDRKVMEFEKEDSRSVGSGWNPDHKSEVYRRELRQAGVDIWFGVMGGGAVVENGRVKGVVVLTPHGRGVVLAGMVIDATGNADIAAAAGAPCRYTDETDVAVQGAGLPPRDLGQKYLNTDFTFVDDTDVFDLWRVLVVGRQKYPAAYDLGQLVDTRERRQIVGDFFFTPMDMMLRRTFPDTVVVARSNFDTHGYTVHPLFMLRPPDREDLDVRVPYRCLLPQGLDRILVTGLGVSAHRDAIPCIRMQPDIQNQGYAAGVAAAEIVRQNISSRALDIKALQKHLIEIGNLPPSVLEETDNFPLPKERILAAVQAVAKDYEQLEVVLAQFDAAQPLLREAYAKAGSGPARLIYAHILGMMGDATGVDALVQAVSSAEWDKGWRYTGMGQFGACMSPLDSQIIALGRTRSPAAVPVIREKAEQLDAHAEFSHIRAVAMALETLGDSSAAKALADLLEKPGMSGHAVTDIESALRDIPTSGTDTSTRNRALSELYLARALYRCGDYQGLGEKILRQYANDLHGHYARHARAVLKQGPKPAREQPVI